MENWGLTLLTILSFPTRFSGVFDWLKFTALLKLLQSDQISIERISTLEKIFVNLLSWDHHSTSFMALYGPLCDLNLRLSSIWRLCTCYSAQEELLQLVSDHLSDAKLYHRLVELCDPNTNGPHIVVRNSILSLLYDVMNAIQCYLSAKSALQVSNPLSCSILPHCMGSPTDPVPSNTGYLRPIWRQDPINHSWLWSRCCSLDTLLLLQKHNWIPSCSSRCYGMGF